MNLARRPDGLFAVTSRPAHGEPVERLARSVVLATGAYDVPNALGVPGEDCPHVSHYYREPHALYRRDVVIVGGKNSAAEAALELYRAGARVLLVHRGEALGESIKYWVKPDIDNRIKEGAIRARFDTRVVEITTDAVLLDGPGGRVREAADAVLLLTGYRFGHDVVTGGRRGDRSGRGRARTQRVHLRDDGAEPLRNRCVRGGEAERPHLHRERPVPWGSGGEDNQTSKVEPRSSNLTWDKEKRRRPDGLRPFVSWSNWLVYLNQ